MIIAVDLTAQDPTPQLRDPDDFKGFEVEVTGAGPDATLRTALASVVSVWIDADHVAIPPGVVRALAGPAAEEPGWEDGFAAMLGYAETKGWIVDGGIRAHVERA